MPMGEGRRRPGLRKEIGKYFCSDEKDARVRGRDINVKKLKKCGVCGKYTMKAKDCGTGTETAHPPKYSPQDKYAEYRRREKFGKGMEGG
ncbi:Ribosome biogenesis protein Nop10 [Candidatus Burarchaeum australiense]|nr:Ribosome biogenesis protein Nop10 [Candidatus Burarchaeum australiense]